MSQYVYAHSMWATEDEMIAGGSKLAKPIGVVKEAVVVDFGSPLIITCIPAGSPS